MQVSVPFGEMRGNAAHFKTDIVSTLVAGRQGPCCLKRTDRSSLRVLATGQWGAASALLAPLGDQWSPKLMAPWEEVKGLLHERQTSVLLTGVEK